MEAMLWYRRLLVPGHKRVFLLDMCAKEDMDRTLSKRIAALSAAGRA
jgi:hypothetical protein